MIKDLKIDELKEVYNTTINYLEGAGNNHSIKYLEEKGYLDDYKIKLDKTLYRGLCNTKQNFNKKLLCETEQFGSCSTSKGIASSFANELIADDIINSILTVNSNNFIYVIDMYKLSLDLNEIKKHHSFRMPLDDREYYVCFKGCEIEILDNNTVIKREEPNDILKAFFG